MTLNRETKRECVDIFKIDFVKVLPAKGVCHRVSLKMVETY